MRPLLVAAALALTCGLFAADDKPLVLDLWKGEMPGPRIKEEEKDLTKPKEHLVAGKRVIRLGHVSTPTITVYRPAKEKNTGTAVIVCPGGGYNILAWDLEGTEVATWLNSLGVTAVVLKYRVPRRPGEPGDQPPSGPLQDAQKAMSLVRSKAKEWDVKPDRIGILGFSAGGHLAASASILHNNRTYPTDKEEVSCRPDFTLLIYPAYLINADKTALRKEFEVTKDTPPMFLVHAADDGVPSENSALLYLALRKAKVSAELHIFAAGGHGYGLRKTAMPVTAWPDLAGEWLKTRGLLGK
jgi:acetyl esterase/lipase